MSCLSSEFNGLGESDQADRASLLFVFGVVSDAACVRAVFFRLHAELCRGSILHGELIAFRRLEKGARGACRQLEPWRVATKKQFA